MSASRVVVKTVSSVCLAFGLEWFAVISQDAQHEARRIARRHRANYLALTGDDASCVGLAMPGSVLTSGAPVYSAALLAARHVASGTLAMVIPVGDQWWLLAVHDGAVIARTDRLCASYADAVAIVDSLYQAYPALAIMDAGVVPTLDNLALNHHTQALLRRVASPLSWMPGPLRWLLFILGVAVVIASLYNALLAPAQIDAKKPQPTPEQAWRKAIQDAAGRYWVHGVVGSAAVLHTLYKLPSMVGGWQLDQAQCDATASLWHCTARFQRHGRDATNQTFLEHSQSAWRVDFTPLEQAVAHWTVDGDTVPVIQAEVTTVADNERHLFSRLQAIKPAIPGMVISESTAMPVVAPVDSNNQRVLKPAGVSLFHARAVRIRAPLRSASLLLPYYSHFGWQRVAIVVGAVAKPSLADSRITVTFEGSLYEKNE